MCTGNAGALVPCIVCRPSSTASVASRGQPEEPICERRVVSGAGIDVSSCFFAAGNSSTLRQARKAGHFSKKYQHSVLYLRVPISRHPRLPLHCPRLLSAHASIPLFRFPLPYTPTPHLLLPPVGITFPLFHCPHFDLSVPIPLGSCPVPLHWSLSPFPDAFARPIRP